MRGAGGGARGTDGDVMMPSLTGFRAECTNQLFIVNWHHFYELVSLRSTASGRTPGYGPGSPDLDTAVTAPL